MFLYGLYTLWDVSMTQKRLCPHLLLKEEALAGAEVVCVLCSGLKAGLGLTDASHSDTEKWTKVALKKTKHFLKFL